MKLSKKNMTKLLNADYRKQILSQMSDKRLSELFIYDYAHYVVDNQIVSRDMSLKDDKKSYYGFQPLGILCYVDKNNNVQRQFFEFNIVNHFLKDYDGDSAVDVIECVLIMWYKENKDILNFNYELIDKNLVELEKEYTKNHKKEDNNENKK